MSSSGIDESPESSMRDAIIQLESRTTETSVKLLKFQAIMEEHEHALHGTEQTVKDLPQRLEKQHVDFCALHVAEIAEHGQGLQDLDVRMTSLWADLVKLQQSLETKTLQKEPHWNASIEGMADCVQVLKEELRNLQETQRSVRDQGAPEPTTVLSQAVGKLESRSEKIASELQAATMEQNFETQVLAQSIRDLRELQVAECTGEAECHHDFNLRLSTMQSNLHLCEEEQTVRLRMTSSSETQYDAYALQMLEKWLPQLMAPERQVREAAENSIQQVLDQYVQVSETMARDIANLKGEVNRMPDVLRKEIDDVLRKQGLGESGQLSTYLLECNKAITALLDVQSTADHELRQENSRLRKEMDQLRTKLVELADHTACPASEVSKDSSVVLESVNESNRSIPRQSARAFSPDLSQPIPGGMEMVGQQSSSTPSVYVRTVPTPGPSRLGPSRPTASFAPSVLAQRPQAATSVLPHGRPGAMSPQRPTHHVAAQNSPLALGSRRGGPPSP